MQSEALSILNTSGIEGEDAQTGLDAITRIIGTDDIHEIALGIPVDTTATVAKFGHDAARHALVLRRALSGR